MKAIERKYAQSNNDLMMLASDFISFMNRDSVEFAVRGVDATDITAFEDLGNAFEIFPSDSEFVGLIQIQVDAKNAIRDSLMMQIQSVSGFMDQAFGESSGEVKRLGIKGVIKKGDKSFLYISREVHRIATEYFTTLTAIGFTQLALDKIDTDAQLFEDKMNAISDAKATRDDKTQERNEKGNELYTFVQKYSKIGKAIWNNVNQARYNDYIIHHTVHSGLGKVQNLAGVYVPISGENPAVIDLSWNLVAGATVYEVLVSIVPIGNLSGSFAIVGTSVGANFQDTNVTIIPMDYYYKVQARNDTQAGAPSDEFKVQAS